MKESGDPDNANTFHVDKATPDVKHEMMDKKHIFLTEDLRRKEGLQEEIEEQDFKCGP